MSGRHTKAMREQVAVTGSTRNILSTDTINKGKDNCMTALNYLADLCSKIDETYTVSLEYGAHAGDIPHWQMRASLPHKGISLMCELVRGDDAGANLEAAYSLGKDIEREVLKQNLGKDIMCEVLKQKRVQ